MKFSKIIVTLASVLSVARAADADVAEDSPAKGNFTPTPEKPFDLRVEYLVQDKQTEKTAVIAAENGETIAIDYKFYNGEEEDCTLVGVGGTLVSPVTGETLYNVTATNIGPLTIASGDVAPFIQKIGIDLKPDAYLLVPAIYIVFKDQLMVLGSRNQLIQVEDPKISLFNPKLLILEIILVGSFGILAYSLYNMFGAQYFTSLKKETKKVKAPVPTTVKSTGAKSVDDSWLPATHLKTKKSTKKTK